MSYHQSHTLPYTILLPVHSPPVQKSYLQKKKNNNNNTVYFKISNFDTRRLKMIQNDLT